MLLISSSTILYLEWLLDHVKSERYWLAEIMLFSVTSQVEEFLPNHFLIFSATDLRTPETTRTPFFYASTTFFPRYLTFATFPPSPISLSQIIFTISGAAILMTSTFSYSLWAITFSLLASIILLH